MGFPQKNRHAVQKAAYTRKDCEKLNPCIQIQPGETVTLCDTDGPGMVTHMWFTLWNLVYLMNLLGKQ